MERFGNVKTCQNSESENEAEEEREKEGAVVFFSRGEILLFYVAALNGLPAGSCNSNNNTMASEVLSLGSQLGCRWPRRAPILHKALLLLRNFPSCVND